MRDIHFRFITVGLLLLVLCHYDFLAFKNNKRYLLCPLFALSLIMLHLPQSSHFEVTERPEERVEIMDLDINLETTAEGS